MSKSVIISDTHCGARNSSEIFIQYQEDFYSKVLFPYMLENDITHIIHAGDYYDHRKFVNFKALNANNEHFLDKLVEFNIKMDIIPGNHDVYYKNTNKLNSLQVLMQNYTSHVSIHMDPVEINEKCCLIPWITADNYGQVMNFVSKTEVPVCIGHFEFSGFELYPGTIAQHGMDASLFRKFDLVLSGHYHTKSSYGNTTYLGAQMEFTWADADDPKFFHVIDWDDLSITTVQNPITLFQKVNYNDVIYNYTDFDFSIFDNKYVKVIVDKKTDAYLFEKFVDNIQLREIHDLKIVENFEMIVTPEDEDIAFEDTSELLNKFVESMDTQLDKDTLSAKLQDLYRAAQELEFE